MSEDSDSSGLYMSCSSSVNRQSEHYATINTNSIEPSLNTPTSSIPSDTPTRPGGIPDINTERCRGLSRSFSVPDMTRSIINPSQSESEDDGSHSISPVAMNNDLSTKTSTRHSTSSVKHLTCFWWKEKGSCRFSDEDCLYAHRDTGHYTDPPRQLFPGEPALAGRKLDRAMRNLAIGTQRSSVSLNSHGGGSRQGTRPSTPVLNTAPTPTALSFGSSINSPLSLPPHFNTDLDLARLTGDNQFLRTLVDQNGKEKAIMISTIEALQGDTKAMKGELEGLRKAQDQLLAEREGLHKRIKQLEGDQGQNFTAQRSVSNPFGAIGRGRVNTEARYLGGLLKEE